MAPGSVHLGVVGAVANSAGPLVTASSGLQHAAGTSIGDGQYRISNRLSKRTNWYDTAWFFQVGDRTTLEANGGKGSPDGLLMLINADASPHTFYEEVVTVTPGTNYEFSLWAAHGNNPDDYYWTSVRPPDVGNLEFAVDRIGVDDDGDGVVDQPGEAQVLVSSGSIAASQRPVWRQYAASFFSGDATSVRFIFRNKAVGTRGNDLAIDDLTLAECRMLPVGTVRGVLYVDRNGNDARDAGELERLPAGMTVELLDKDGVVIATVLTDSAGAYRFDNIPVDAARRDQVRVRTDDAVMPSTMRLGTLQVLDVEFASGASESVHDFGYDRSALLLRKTWVNAVVGDQATVQLSRAGTVIGSLLSTADNANETDVSAGVVDVTPGEALELSETLAAVGLYDPVSDCDLGTLSGSTLTVAATAGALTTCTVSNTRQQVDLSVSKSNGVSQVVRGSATTYTIVVTNVGPAAATGAVLADTASAGLTCAAGAAVTCTGAGCPATVVTVGQLGAGIVLGTIGATAPSNTVTLTVPCTVD